MRSLLASCVVVVAVVGLPACRLISEGIACDPDNPATCPAGTVCNADAVCVSGNGVPVGEPVCGDGFVNGSEACDFVLDRVDCNFDCTLGACGDGKIDGDEACDSDDAVCVACALVGSVTCGNGEIEAGEACDPGSDVVDCNLDCTEAVCGDGKVSPAEVCDDNNEVGDDGCAADCLTLDPAPFCGDGDNAGEPCDASDPDENRACNADCTLSVCGDGVTGPDEQCDEGAAAPLRGLDGASDDATFEIDGDVGLPSRN